MNRIKHLLKFIREPYRILGWLYGAYLTLRYVDQHTSFPAIQFRKPIIKLKILKGKDSQLIINGKLIIEPWLDKFTSEVSLGKQAKLTIANDFIVGDDVHIRLSNGAEAFFGGRNLESGSGITARSVLMINNHLYIGTDCLIAWDTLIADYDGHQYSSPSQKDRFLIGDHVWIANGVKILKGSFIGDNSIVACGSVVTGNDFPSFSLIAGMPAKVIKSNILTWQR